MRLASLVSDLRLDIEQVGEYLAQIAPTVSYNRLITIAESAQYHKEEKYNGEHQYLWLNYKQDSEFGDFVEYNDMGLPLAFFISQEIIQTNDVVTNYVNETWDLFLESLNTEDTGFSTLDELLMRFDK